MCIRDRYRCKHTPQIEDRKYNKSINEEALSPFPFKLYNRQMQNVKGYNKIHIN